MENQIHPTHEPDRRRTAQSHSSRSSQENVAMENRDFDRECHQESVRKLIIKGLLGFAAGILFTAITSSADHEPFHIGFALIIGLFFSGIPYGWEVLGKAVGRWYAVGSFPVMLLVLIFQLVCAILIGWIAFPVALLYHLRRAQAPGSTGEKVVKIIQYTLLGFVAFIIIVVLISNAASHK